MIDISMDIVVLSFTNELPHAYLDFVRYRLNLLHTNLRTDYKSNQISHINNANTKPLHVLEIFHMIFPDNLKQEAHGPNAHLSSNRQLNGVIIHNIW